MSFVAVAIGVSAAAGIAGAVLSSKAGSKQARAAERASEISQEQYEQTREDLMPWQKAGKVALSQLGPLTQDLSSPLLRQFTLEDFYASPSYQFNLAEGERAIKKAAAARGNYYAPQTLQDISRFSQGLASNEFQQAMANYYGQQGAQFGRLFALSGAGQSAAGQTGAFGAQAAGDIGQNLAAAANARAAGMIGAGNILAGTAGDITNQIMLRDILTRSAYMPAGGGWTPASGAQANWYGPLSPFG
jgi:hypothetical protein